MKKSALWEGTAFISLFWGVLVALLIPTVIGTFFMGIGLASMIYCLHKQIQENIKDRHED